MKNILTLILCLLFCGCSIGQSKSGSTYPAIITQDTTKIDGYVVEIGNYKATRLGEACGKGDLAGVIKLLNDGADKEQCLSDDIYEYDIVYAAVYFNKVDILKFLITQKEDVNKVYNENGLTAAGLYKLKLGDSLVVVRRRSESEWCWKLRWRLYFLPYN